MALLLLGIACDARGALLALGPRASHTWSVSCPGRRAVLQDATIASEQSFSVRLLDSADACEEYALASTLGTEVTLYQTGRGFVAAGGDLFFVLTCGPADCLMNSTVTLNCTSATQTASDTFRSPEGYTLVYDEVDGKRPAYLTVTWAPLFTGTARAWLPGCERWRAYLDSLVPTVAGEFPAGNYTSYFFPSQFGLASSWSELHLPDGSPVGHIKYADAARPAGDIGIIMGGVTSHYTPAGDCGMAASEWSLSAAPGGGGISARAGEGGNEIGDCRAALVGKATLFPLGRMRGKKARFRFAAAEREYGGYVYCGTDTVLVDLPFHFCVGRAHVGGESDLSCHSKVRGNSCSAKYLVSSMGAPPPPAPTATRSAEQDGAYSPAVPAIAAAIAMAGLNFLWLAALTARTWRSSRRP